MLATWHLAVNWERVSLQGRWRRDVVIKGSQEVLATFGEAEPMTTVVLKRV